MKTIIKAAVAGFVLSVIFSMIPFQASCNDISDEVFRLHILANSDSEEDQSLKLKVRDKVLEHTESLFVNARSKQEAESLISENLQNVADVAAKEVRDNGYTYSVKAQIIKMHFSTRHYDNYTLPSGMYDALRISIGEGKGHNWWCVMFPSICVSPQKDRDEKAKEVFSDGEYRVVKSETAEYKFYIVELFENICMWFDEQSRK